MQEDLFRCSFCSQLYDMESHLPKVLVYCSHYLCLQCLKMTFALYSPQRRKCPICNVGFPPKIKTPEDLVTDTTLLQLLPTRPKSKIGDDMEYSSKRDLNNGESRHEGEHLLEGHHVRKKQKIGQFVNDTMIKLKEEQDPFQQTPQENDLSLKIEEEETQTKMEASSSAVKFEVTDKVTGNRGKIKEEFDEKKEKSQSQNQQIKEELQEMKRQIMQIQVASLLRLDFSQKDIPKTIFNYLCSQDFWDGINKNKFLYFEVLELDFSASSLTDQQFVRFVQNIMPALENLTSLMMNFALTKISSKSLQALSDQFLKKHKLKSFVLNCSQTSIGDEGFKSLDEGLLCSLDALEKVELMFDATDVQGDEFLDALFGMDRLKHLKLSFENSQVSSEIVSSVVFSLSSLAKNLESLDLNLNRTDVDDKDLENFASHAISQMKGLKYFKLCLGETFISNDSLLAFFQSLSPLAIHLEALELDLHSTKLSNPAFKRFCEMVLSNMQNLESLKLDLSQTRITDLSLKNFIFPSNKLETLSLNLSENRIHDTGFQKFKENNKFQSIKNISIQVEQTGVGEEALQDFFNHIEKSRLAARNGASPQTKNDINIPKESDLKRKVLLELKKELSLHYDSKSGSSHLQRSIDKLESRVYEDILMKTLTKTLPNSKITVTELAEWEKVIESIRSSSLLPNKEFNKTLQKKKLRGLRRKEAQKSIEGEQSHLTTRKKRYLWNDKDPRQTSIIPCECVLSFQWLKKYAKEISLRDKVIEILKSMETRTFYVFYQRLLDFLLGLSNSYQVWQFSPKLDYLNYSYSWWSRFIRGDQEIASLWRNLPFSRE